MAAGAVIDLLHEVDVLLETLSAAPVSELRSGGLGIRDVKRLSKVTGIDEPRLGLILEVAAAAGLIASGMPDPEPVDGDGTVLGADDRRRPVRRDVGGRTLAAVGQQLARPSRLGRR